MPMELDGRPLKDAPYCLTGTWGAELYGIDARPGEEIVDQAPLQRVTGTRTSTCMLRSRGIQTVILTGVGHQRVRRIDGARRLHARLLPGLRQRRHRHHVSRAPTTPRSQTSISSSARWRRRTRSTAAWAATRAATARRRARAGDGRAATGTDRAAMAELVGQVIFGLAIGSIYSLVAIGFSMIYRATGSCTSPTPTS